MKKALRQKLKEAAPVIVSVSLLTLVLTHMGWLHRFEMAFLDSWLGIRGSRQSQTIVIVDITEDDYKELFGKKSPLNPYKLQEVIEAIASGMPKVIGIDLDTSGEEFRTLTPSSEWPPIVWAQDASQKISEDEPEPWFEPAGVLGGTDTLPLTGLALLPQDADGIVRRYRREFKIRNGKTMEAFAWAVAKTFKREPSLKADVHETELLLNFSGDRYSFKRISAKYVLEGAKGPGWRTRGPLTERIVLLGGKYRAARDEYITPLGPMAGVELMAQAIESDLHGDGIRSVNECWMILVEVGVGFLLVALYHYFADVRDQLKTAFLLSLVALPFVALLCSLITFWSLSLWMNFVPLLTAVVIDQLYDRAKEYHEMYEELHRLTKAREDL